MLTRDLKNPFLHRTSVAPGSELSGTTPVAGSWIDMNGTIGPTVAIVPLAAASGSPSGQAHVVKIRQADSSGGTGAEDIAEATFTVTADASLVVIQARNRSKRYVQVHITPAFTGGTTPKVLAAGIVSAQKESY